MAFEPRSFTDADLTDFSEDEDDSVLERCRLTPAEEVVRQMIAAHLEVDAKDIKARHHLERDLGITRLGLVLIGLDLEDLEGVTLPFELLAEVDTVEQLARFFSAARRDSKPLVSVLGR